MHYLPINNNIYLLSNDNIKHLRGPETMQDPLNPKSFLIFTALRGISFIFSNIYLTVLGLSCGMWDL